MSSGDDLDELIRRAQGGDVAAFEKLLQGQLPRVRRFARAFASSASEADDLAQEALIKVYKSIRHFQYQSAFSSWLYAVVRNVFLDALKSRHGRQKQREEPLEATHTQQLSGGDDPEGELHRAQEKDRLWRALRQVPVEFRTALVLFDIEGHSYDELAAIEGVPVGTVKSRLSRGRAALRKLLEAEPFSDTREETLGEAGTNATPAPSNAGRGR